jgi:hypothetical protein
MADDPMYRFWDMEAPYYGRFSSSCPLLFLAGGEVVGRVVSSIYQRQNRFSSM